MSRSVISDEDRELVKLAMERLSGMTTRDAGAVVGVSHTQIWDWRRGLDPEEDFELSPLGPESRGKLERFLRVADAWEARRTTQEVMADVMEEAAKWLRETATLPPEDVADDVAAEIEKRPPKASGEENGDA